VIDGADHWTCRTLRDQVLDKVEELSRDGMPVRDIAAELNLSKSKISRMQARLRMEGRL
jgi:transposase